MRTLSLKLWPSQRFLLLVSIPESLLILFHQLLTSIQKVIPSFKITYERGMQQDIAHSWPDSMDDSNARKDWGWDPTWDLDKMTVDMIKQIREIKGKR